MDQITVPTGQVVELRQIFHESGARLLRVIIRDGVKYMTVELDPATAYDWGRQMQNWARDVAQGP